MTAAGPGGTARGKGSGAGRTTAEPSTRAGCDAPTRSVVRAGIPVTLGDIRSRRRPVGRGSGQTKDTVPAALHSGPGNGSAK